MGSCSMGTNPPEVCIVGAGLGGLALAAILSATGCHVEVHERCNDVGGRCKSLKLGSGEEIYQFDVGASMLMMLDVLDELDVAMGRPKGSLKKSLDLRQCCPSSAVYFSGNAKPFELWTDLHKMRPSLETTCPEENIDELFRAYLQFLCNGSTYNSVAHSLILKQSFSSIRDAFTFSNIALAATGLRSVSLYAYAQRLFKSPGLSKALTFQTMYMGLSPFKALSCYSMLVYNELTEGIWYPASGMARIPQACREALVEHGGEVHVNSEVSRITFKECSSLPVVRFSSGKEKEYDAVVCNADLPYAYRSLIQDDRASAILEHMEYGCSTISFYWGISKDLHGQLHAHQVFLGKSYEGAFDAIFNQRGIPESLSFYVHVSSHLNRSACPQGHSCLTVLVPVGCDSATAIDTAKCRAQILKTLESCNISIREDDIAQEHVLGPDQWRDEFKIARGAALGLNHQFTQLGPFRPSNQDYKRPRLFFVGASTQPGAGVPSVIYSAILTARLVKKEMSRDRSSWLQQKFPTWLHFHWIIGWLKSLARRFL